MDGMGVFAECGACPLFLRRFSTRAYHGTPGTHFPTELELRIPVASGDVFGRDFEDTWLVGVEGAMVAHNNGLGGRDTCFQELSIRPSTHVPPSHPPFPPEPTHPHATAFPCLVEPQV